MNRAIQSDARERMSDGDSTKKCRNAICVGEISRTKLSANWVHGYRAEGP